MAFYTKEYLSGKTFSVSESSFNKFVNESKFTASFDVFLSHSYSDKQYIRALFSDLSEMGYSVYVDWIIDPHLNRSEIGNRTVSTIRGRMQQSASLIYATSQSASKSKWMPWELGFMDGNKEKCAILPIMDYAKDTFKGQEFLSVYPYITIDEQKDSGKKERIRVHQSAFDYTRMNDWISTN